MITRITLAKLVTLNPKLKSTGAGLPASFRWWDAYRKQLGLKTSRKSGVLALQQIKGRGTALIDRGDIRQAIDRCGNIWASPGAGYGQFRHKPDN